MAKSLVRPKNGLVNKKPGKAGRPTDLTPQMMVQIFDWVCEGLTNKTISMRLGIASMTFYRWKKHIPEFKEMMDEAYQIKAQNYIDEIIEIADDDSKDLVYDDMGNAKPNAAAVARSKLRMQARQKVSSYLAPKLFGENATKVDITANGDNVFLGLCITPPKDLEDDE